MKLYRALVLALSASFFFSHAYAEVIYENGAFSGTNQAAAISPPQSLSNSFTVDADARLTDATVGLWSTAGSEPLTLTWSIGTTPFAADVASATVSLNNALQIEGEFFWVYLSNFSLDVLLDAGDYWFTLSNGASVGDPFLGWDINNGPSEAFFRNLGDQGEAPSEYFRLEGVLLDDPDPDPDPVPEPASIAIMALGLVGLASARRRQTGR